MPKKRPEDILTPEQLEMQKQGQKVLHNYFHEKNGRQRIIAERTGIFASMLSRMACGHSPITLESAIALELATEGELRAEVLCPVRADVLQRFMSQRLAGA